MANAVVWKFEIRVQDEFFVDMPEGAKVVHVDVQHGKPCMWALVRLGSRVQTRRFHVRGTGHQVEDGLSYLGSFMLVEGNFVGHLFEKTHA